MADELSINTEIIRKFVVIEGLDGSGTTTQLGLLKNRLSRKAAPFFTTFEPTDNPPGKLIRKALSLDLSFHPATLAHLYAADRHEHLYGKNGILEHIAKGKIVISDRYIFSSLAYQSIDCGMDFVFHLNKLFPLPELVLFIDAEPRICQERITRRDKKELFDGIRFQEKVRKGYLRAFSLYKATPMRIEIIDGTDGTETILEKIWNIFTGMSIITP